jgi:hypothetical protein
LVDQKPPRFERDERTVLLGLFQYQRESLVRKVEGVSDEDARRSPVGSGTSLLWLVRHVAAAEVLWVLRRFAGQDVPVPDQSLPPGDGMAAAIADYRATWAQVDEVIAASSFDDPCRGLEDDLPTNLRWVVAHLLEETARHAGHADILRELLDGHVGR